MRIAPVRFSTLLLPALLLLCALAPAAANADRELHSATFLDTKAEPNKPPQPPPDGQIEAACGLAVSPLGQIFVSDYYHRAIELFSTSGGYISRTVLTGAPEGPCGLALSPSGELYANIWHQRVERLNPPAVIDARDSTGVAVDQSGNVYVAGRGRGDPATNAPPPLSTYVAVYDPTGVPLLAEGEPLRIGRGSLGDPFGLAVSAGIVYVADASDDTVKAFDLALSVTEPAFVIGGFNSLRDAALAIDPTTGHLLVVDNLEPGFLHPRAAVLEFEADGTYLDTLAPNPVHGEPSGIAVNPATGFLYVTDGNDEGSNVFAFGPYAPGSPAPDEAPAEQQAPALATSAFQPSSPAPLATPPAPEAGKRVVRPKRPRHRRHPRLGRARQVAGPLSPRLAR